MPCLDYLARVRGVHREIAALGVRVIAVSAGSVAQAKALMAEGTPFPCLVDAERELYAALGLGRFGLGVFFRPDTWANYLRAWRRGAPQGARSGDWRQQSGVALFDASLRLVWIRRSATVGDYPAPAELLGAAAAVAETRR